jgi:hypothetical protein
MEYRRKLQHYRTKIKGKKPTIDDLYEGEIVINTQDEKLFFKTVDGEIAEVDSAKNTKQTITDEIEKRVFIGTLAEYQEAYAAGKIAVGALVIIMDEGEDANDTIALLGTAVLGKMILGQK